MKPTLDNFFRRPKEYATALRRVIGHYEKVILAMLAVVIVISGSIWYRQFASSHDGSPAAGGSYVEGIVGGENEVRQLSLRLTKTGFFAADNDGKLSNVLVRDWRVNAEKTEYTFALNKGVDPEEIVRELQGGLELLGPAAVDTNEAGEVTIKLSEPNPNIPVVLAQPLFDYGPYKLSKMSGQTAIFSRNAREGAVQPYINKVIVHTYPTQEELQQALNKGKIDGAESENLTIPNRYTLRSFELPRFYAVIFNLNKSPFREPELRRALIDGTPAPSTTFVLTAADQEPNKTIAAQLVARWQAQGVPVNLDLRPVAEIQDKVGPSRTFQALLTGIDYGAELDPIYLWHSANVRPPGNNLAGIRHELVDAQIAAVRNTTNIAERLSLIKTLHKTVEVEGAALFVRQETTNFITAEKIVFQTPWLARIPADRLRSIARWYVK
jgi:ABC-type transport system substrate-binding protein